LTEAHNDYAWMLATAPDPRLRNGALALEHARRAVARVESPAYLDTLAAAYAELGQFADAVSTQEKAIALADASDTALVDELQAHLDAYRSGEPWRG
jgi:tetratricopeptide (TPR) repeat protein